MAPSEAAERTTAPNLRLRAFREARSESRREFARALRRMAETMGENLACDERRVARWERGEVRWPRSAYRRVLSTLLGVSADDLGFQPPAEVTKAMAASSDSDSWSPAYQPPAVPRRSALPAAGAVPFVLPPDRDAAATERTAVGTEGPVFGPVLDLSPGTLEGLESAADDLCRDYGRVRSADRARANRMRWPGGCSRTACGPDRRRLLVVCGWLGNPRLCAVRRRPAARRDNSWLSEYRRPGRARRARCPSARETWFALAEAAGDALPVLRQARWRPANRQSRRDWHCTGKGGCPTA
jgi:transcriptional regulator with XRE-family HTH domain